MWKSPATFVFLSSQLLNDDMGCWSSCLMTHNTLGTNNSFNVDLEITSNQYNLNVYKMWIYRGDQQQETATACYTVHPFSTVKGAVSG